MGMPKRRRFEKRKSVYDDATEQRIQAFQKQVEYLRSLPYDEYLKTKHWLTLREKVHKRANGKCEYCRFGRPMYAVHHKTYARLGAELLADLEAVCHKCHKFRHYKTHPYR